MGKKKEHKIIDGVDHVQCLKCGKWLPLNTEYWVPNNSSSSGFHFSMCRECRNAYYREYSKNNPEWRREKERKYAERNPEKYAAKQARHHQRYKEAGGNKYCNRNIEKDREREREREKTPERKEYNKQRWQKRKVNGYNDRAKELYAINPLPKIISVNKRRAAKQKASGTHNRYDFEDKLIYYGYKCYYCGKELTINNATQDHRIPLSRGGTDWIANIVPACKSCNSSKGTKTEQEYWEYLMKYNERAL